MTNSHPAVRPDDLRKVGGNTRKQMQRDRREAIKRLGRMSDYDIMRALRSNGLYSHRTGDAEIMAFVNKIRQSLHMV